MRNLSRPPNIPLVLPLIAPSAFACPPEAIALLTRGLARQKRRGNAPDYPAGQCTTSQHG